MRKKLVQGVGVSDSGEFIRTYVDEFGKKRGTKEYSLWLHMLFRCYSEKCHSRCPTYVGCSVSENFQSFQYFSKWCQHQVGFEFGCYQLDKDLLLKGNKLYSEGICVFVPSNINRFLVSCRSSRGKFPIGVSMYRNKYYRAMIRDGTGKRILLGDYNTPELAFKAYKTAKENIAKELAIQYEGLVDPRVIVALNNYVVNIDD